MTGAPDLDDYVLALVLADELGMDKGNMRSHIRRGKVEGVKIGSRWFVGLAEAERFKAYYTKTRRRPAKTEL